jgi:large subunit ribosomal protein L22
MSQPVKERDRSREARAIERYLRISPRKVRLVINAIRRKPALQALGDLRNLNKKAARLVEKGLKSAVANAKGKGLEESRLIVSEVKADGGPVFKRFMSRSMGRADQILKRTSHLTIVVREEKSTFGLPATAEAGKKAKQEKPKKEKQAAAKKKSKKAMAQAG